MPWQAEEAPDPRLLVLNEPLAAELGLDPASLREPRRGRSPDRHPGPRRGDAGGPGLRRPPVRRLLPPPRRRPRAAARRADGHRRPAARPAPQGLRAHAVRARRRRAGGGRADAARVRRQRGDARPRHPHHPLAGRGRHRAAGPPRDRAARAPCSPGWPAATCGWAASSTPGPTGDVDVLRRLADHAIARHHPAAAVGRAALPRAVRGGRLRAGVAAWRSGCWSASSTA